MQFKGIGWFELKCPTLQRDFQLMLWHANKKKTLDRKKHLKCHSNPDLINQTCLWAKTKTFSTVETEAEANVFTLQKSLSFHPHCFDEKVVFFSCTKASLETQRRDCFQILWNQREGFTIKKSGQFWFNFSFNLIWFVTSPHLMLIFFVVL